MEQVLSVAAATRDAREANATRDAEGAFDPSKARPLKQLKIGSLYKKYQEEHPEVKKFNKAYGDVFTIPEASKQVYAMKGFNVNANRFFNDYEKQYHIRLGLYSKAKMDIQDQQRSKVKVKAASVTDTE
jgi:hypothetical protein